MAEKIQAAFKNSSDSYEIKITERPGHGEVLAREAAQSLKHLRVYSVGGDGTLNEVVNGLAGTGVELGIIPCGSGNDTVRSLYAETDPVRLIELLPDAPSEMVDLGKINSRYFLNIASIGFDAEVVLKSRLFRRFPLVSGSMAYILGVLATLIRLKKYRLRITYKDLHQKEKDVLLAIFANGSFYGGGMKSAPRAKMNDGLLDFYEVEAVPRRTIFRFFPRFKKGEHESMKEVTLYRGTQVVIESDTPFPMNMDGEITMESRVAIEILPHAFKIIVPQRPN
jgi:YegS/Rv2252/BmrU family lipid kinase